MGRGLAGKAEKEAKPGGDPAVPESAVTQSLAGPLNAVELRL